MPNQYLSVFKEKIINSGDIAKELDNILTKYLMEQAAVLENNHVLHKNLTAFQLHLKTAQIGYIVRGFNFSSLSQELREVFEFALMREEVSLRAPSPLVSCCENNAAALGRTAKAIFEQTIILGQALNNNKVPLHHRSEVKNKIDEWIGLLYQKFAALILEAKNIEELKKSVDTNFEMGECALTLIVRFREAIDSQIEYYENKGLLKNFYDTPSFAKKYDVVYDFCEEVVKKEKTVVTAELKEVMLSLYEAIPEQAFQPYQKKLHALMGEGLSVKKIFKILEEWGNVYDKKSGDTPLAEEIKYRLVDMKKSLEDWQKVRENMLLEITNTFSDAELREKTETLARTKPPAYEVFCVKYSTGDPSQDPKVLLSQYNQEPKRKKRKSGQDTPVESPKINDEKTTSGSDLTIKQQLYCDESLKESVCASSNKALAIGRL